MSEHCAASSRDRATALKPAPVSLDEALDALEAMLYEAECDDYGEVGIDHPVPATHTVGATCPVCVGRALLRRAGRLHEQEAQR